MKWRVNLVYICILLVALAIIFRMAMLIFVDGDKWRSRAENKTTRSVDVEAKRGNIYSVDMGILVMTRPIFTVRMDLYETVILKDTFNFYVKALADSLAKMFSQKTSSEWLKDLMEARFKDLGLNTEGQASRGRGIRNFVIARNIKYLRFADFITPHQIRCLFIVSNLF